MMLAPERDSSFANSEKLRMGRGTAAEQNEGMRPERGLGRPFQIMCDNDTNPQNACAEFIRSALSTIPSLLERLIFLTSLKDPGTGDYDERVLALKFGKEEVDRVLADEHRAVFEAWLCLNLKDQAAELERYAAKQDAPPRAVFSAWAHDKLYRRLIPPGAIKAQRDLFVTDMEVVLDLLMAEAAGG